MSAVVCGSFDDLRLHHVRFLDAASRLGPLHVILWSDPAAAALDGQPPKFPLAERQYFIESIRYVSKVTIADPTSAPAIALAPGSFLVQDPADTSPAKTDFAKSLGLPSRTLAESDLAGFPIAPPTPAPGRKKVLITGCYDWLHTGHVRFFEEVSEHGDVYAVVGHDANILLLKGPGHPQFSQDHRRYMVGAIRFVTQSLISTGHGWLDAEPEIRALRPDIYAVNEDGDKPDKRDFCQKNGIQYLVLKRTPKPGLPRRESTKLRGF